MTQAQQQPDRPVVSSLASKLSTIERRIEYLRSQITEGRGSPGALDFARAEVSALESAVLIMKYHRLVVMDLDTPLAVLRAFSVAWEKTDRQALSEAAKRAQLVLEDLGRVLEG